MNRLFVAIGGFGLAGAAILAAQPSRRSAPAPETKSSAPASKIDHGAYIANHVAMCIQCHTPRDEDGNLIPTRILSGAPVPLASPYSAHPWAYRAPNIRGMVGYTDEEGLRLLMQGITRNGTPPRPPMQQFGMNREDAEAVVAYLKSLK